MSRLGPSVRPLVFGAAVPNLAMLPPDADRPPLPFPVAVVVALALDALVFVAAPRLAALASRPLLPVVDGRVALLLLPFGVAAVASFGGYRAGVLLRGWAGMGAALAGALTALVATGFAVLVLVGAPHITGPWTVATVILLGFGILAGRGTLALRMLRHPEHRFAARTVIVRGSAGSGLGRQAGQDVGHGARVIGFVADAVAPEPAEPGSPPYLGGIDQVVILARRGLLDRVVVAMPLSEGDRILKLVRRLSDYPVEVCLARHALADVGVGARYRGAAMLHLSQRPLSGWSGAVKRAEDLLVGGLALLLCALPMALIALAIRLDSPGPVLFRQRRTGFANRDFEMLKFRTMYHHMADHEVQQQATRNDPRVTRVGAILRRTSLDELPQIFNVLRGEMSIVGPRPHAPGTRAGGRTFDQVVERYAARHRVRPGLTGLAQVRGLRGETRTEDRIVRRVESDLEYIETWSLWLDLRILARTAWMVLRMKNAY